MIEQKKNYIHQIFAEKTLYTSLHVSSNITKTAIAHLNQ